MKRGIGLLPIIVIGVIIFLIIRKRQAQPVATQTIDPNYKFQPIYSFHV